MKLFNGHEIKDNTFTSKNGIVIRLSEVKGHIHLSVKNGKNRINVLTAIASGLNQFERNFILVWAFKHVCRQNESGHSNAVTKDYLNDNYAGVFGSTWE